MNWKTWAQLMPAINVKGSAAAFSPPLLASLLLGGGGGGEVGGLLLFSGTGVSEEGGVSWDVGGGRLGSAVVALEPNVGGMGSDLEDIIIGLVLVKLMPDGSLENPAPVFMKPPELERFTPGGSLKLELSFFGAGFGSLSLFIFVGGSSILPSFSFASFSDFASGSVFVKSSALTFFSFSSTGFSGLGWLGFAL